jgi:hypothetical protein
MATATLSDYLLTSNITVSLDPHHGEAHSIPEAPVPFLFILDTQSPLVTDLTVKRLGHFCRATTGQIGTLELLSSGPMDEQGKVVHSSSWIYRMVKGQFSKLVALEASCIESRVQVSRKQSCRTPNGLRRRRPPSATQ